MVGQTLHDRLRAQVNSTTSTATKEVRNKNAVITRIIEQAQRKTRQDISAWRKAISSAEDPINPDRQQLYALYSDVMLDSHLSGIWEHGRKARVFAQTFHVVDWSTGEVDEDMTQALTAPWAFELMGHIMDSRMYGHSLVELDRMVPNVNVKDVFLIPRTHVIPERGLVVVKPGDKKGIEYRDLDMVVEVGGSRDLGLLVKAAPMMIYKKNAMMAWSEYTEVFGMPILVGRTNSQDNEDVDRMMAGLKSLGSAARAVFQQGEEIDMKSDHRTDVYNVYDKMIDRMNSELSKLILGSTGTVDMNKGAKAQAEVHERTGDDVILTDKRLVAGVWNETVLPMLEQYGWNVKGKKFEYVETQGQDDLWKRTLGLAPFFQIDPQFVKDNFGVEVLEPKEVGSNNTPTALRLKLEDLYNQRNHA